jgi:hypothetical protein
MPWQSSDPIKLPEVNGQNYDGASIKIDGASFRNCTFKRSKLIYCGGPTRLEGCSFAPGCEFEFQDQAAFLLQTLTELGWTLVAPAWMGPPQIR